MFDGNTFGLFLIFATQQDESPQDGNITIWMPFMILKNCSVVSSAIFRSLAKSDLKCDNYKNRKIKQRKACNICTYNVKFQC